MDSTYIHGTPRVVDYVPDGPHVLALVDPGASDEVITDDEFLHLWVARNEDHSGPDDEDVEVDMLCLTKVQAIGLWKLLKRVVPLLDQMAAVAD